MSEIAPIRQRRARRALLTDIGVSKLPRKPKPYFHPDPSWSGTASGSGRAAPALLRSSSATLTNGSAG
jgi:hypothetical protein